MNHVVVLDPLGHLLQQPIMSNIVEVGAKVQVDGMSLPLFDSLGDSLDRCLCCSLRSVSVRPRLEICLEDGFQNELDRSLDHTLPNGRNREDSYFRPPVLGNFVPPVPHGLISERD